MSRTIDEWGRGRTDFQIREVDENAWRVTVCAPSGRRYVCDYAPADPPRAREDGSPTRAEVEDAWRNDRKAFREV